MATAPRGQSPFSLRVDDLCKVAVYNENPESTNANVILECFNTDKPCVVLKSERRSGKVYVQFPVQSHIQTDSTEILKENFMKSMKEYVTKEDSFITIPIDNIKVWAKSKFCETILEEFLQWRQRFPVKLTFCALRRHNFDEAVKVCKNVVGAHSKSVTSSVSRMQGPSIRIVEDSLDRVKADVLACTISSDLDLSCGAVSAALLKRGGKKLQEDLDEISHGRLRFGEIGAVPGHNLPCIYVFFGAMYPYNKEFGKGYKSPEMYYRSSVHEFVQKCLNLAEVNKLRTIAFPAIGSGILQYPVQIVAKEMFETVTDWRGEYVKEVRFVIYPSDKKVLQEFKLAEKRHASSIGGQSGQTPVRTSEFHMKNPCAHSAHSKEECKFPIPEGYTAEFIEMCCEETIDILKKGECDVSITKDAIIVKCPPDVMEIAKTRVTDDLLTIRKEYPSRLTLDLTQSDFNQSDVLRKVEEVKRSLTVNCFINKMKSKVVFFGKKMQDVKAAKDRVVSSLLPPRGKADPDRSKDVEETGGASSQVKPAGISRQFSWSTRTKALNVFETKEKIIVKVYSADILSVPVDCIVNAANMDLKHGGGIARAIEKAAGKDLTQEGHDYLKMHGRLKVGEACSTAAGKMQYGCVIHAVGPCWSYYKPYSLGDVEKCEHDLYNAVINSLAEAEKRKMETVAVSSISSGIYGCPLDLCSVQYAGAVVDYSRCARSPLKEIHFVDTNMEMVKIIQTTFQSMIPGEKIPRSYNKLRHVKSQDAANGRDTADKRTPRNTWTDERQSALKVHDKTVNSYRSHHTPTGESGIVVYPYCHKDFPPGHKQKEFSCCFGAGQNLYIYTGDILSMTNTDMIVCGNIPDGKATGKLAKALSDSGGVPYRNGKDAAFKKNRTFGEVIVCTSGDIKNFKWVAHAILHKKADCKDKRDREAKVNSIFQKVFETLRDKQCHSLAIPLIGTGKGKGDPGYYSERFIDALFHFCSFNKGYPFRIHLINKEKEKTKLAVNATKKAVLDSRPLSVVTKRAKAERGHSRQNAGARPPSAGKQSPNLKHSREQTYHHGASGGASGVSGSKFQNRERENRKGSYGEVRKNKDYNDKAGYQNQSQSPHRRRVEKRHENRTNRNNFGASQWDESENSKDRFEDGRGNRTDTNFKSSQQNYSPASSDAGSDEDELSTNDDTQSKPEGKKIGNLIVIDESNYAKEQVSHGTDKESDESGKEDEEDEEEDADQEVPEEESDKSDDDVEDEVETCVICMDDITDPQQLPCGHVFCTDCIQAQFTYKEVCPTCGKVCGTISGDQPYGKMDVNINERASCVGFEGCGRMEITYRFPEGTQGSNHPVPGARYKGITRTAYLPNNRKGKEICEMLKVAFERKLVFTIGRSRTTGADGVITWNDIHHKTDPKPNTQFGYPDPTYLDRVTEELEVKGVTVNDIPTLSVPKHRRR